MASGYAINAAPQALLGHVSTLERPDRKFIWTSELAGPF